MYGYQLAQEILSRGDGYITIKEGSMYPTLYRLEDKHYISSKKKKVGKRQLRVYYHIENAGREYLQNITREFYAVNQSVRKIIEYKGGG